MYHGYRGVVDVLACPQATFNANLWVFKYYISQINGMCRNYCCCYYYTTAGRCGNFCIPYLWKSSSSHGTINTEKTELLFSID